MIDFGLGVKLDALNERSKDELRAWRNNPLIWRWTRQNDLISELAHKRWFDTDHPSIRMYLLVDSKSGVVVGVTGLTSIDLWNRHAEFSLYIEPGLQRRGYGEMALKTLFYHGFKNMSLRSIWGETFENNPARKLFKKLGMSEDGKRRQFYWKDGRYWDAVIISVTAHEFLDASGDKSCFSA